MAGQQRNEITSAARYVPEEQLETYSSQTGVQILTTVLLQHINAQAAAQATRPFFAQASTQIGGVLTGNLGDNRSVMLQGFGPQVYAAYQVLKLADVPPILPDYETRVVRLENATAEELEPILKQVLEDRSRRIQQGQAGAGAPVAPGQGGEVQVLAHGSLNALLVSGVPDRIVEALDLIAQLDRPIEASSSDIHVIQLKNVLAEDLQNTLRNFLREDLQAERQAQTAQTSAPGARQPRQTVIVAHQESNSLLVSATQSNFKNIERMIGELDERQPQVLIEAALVELRTTDTERLGVELGLLDIADDDFTRPFGFTSFGLTQFEDTDGDGLPDQRLPDFENPLQGFTGGIISSGDFAIPVLINALQTDERANILSLPSVVVNNNENALVKSEEDRPTQVVNQGTATTSTGVGESRRAGIELNISPSISTNDYLRLNIDLIVSRFLTAVDPTTGGPILSRQVSTQVTLPSGSTMVLGGIIEDAESDAESGVPILKDIPLIGWFFRNKTTDRQKTNLYFFVTPTILDEEDFSDLQQLSQRKKLEASQYIGHRRIKIVDPRWTGGPGATLEDPSSTVDDLDRFGGFEIPLYRRPTSPPKLDGSVPTGPDLGEPRFEDTDGDGLPDQRQSEPTRPDGTNGTSGN
jgi:general secretion pathway protein D